MPHPLSLPFALQARGYQKPASRVAFRNREGGLFNSTCGIESVRLTTHSAQLARNTAENEPLIEASKLSSGTSWKTKSRRFFGAAFLLLGIVACCVLGVAYQKLKSPEYRDFTLDMKNGYALSMRAPVEWTVDEKEGARISALYKKTSGDKIASISDLVLHRSKATGIRALLERLFKRDAFAQNLPSSFWIQCHTAPIKFASVPLKRRDEYFDDLQNLIKTLPGGAPGVDLIKDNSYQVGPALRIVSHNVTVNKIPLGKPIVPSQTNHLIFYTTTPDKRRKIEIRTSSSYQVALEKMIGVELRKMSESIRIVPFESMKADPNSNSMIGAKSP